MQHAIPEERYGPAGADMAAAVEACVHCGFCLPTCPTYSLLEEEMDSPRGRIFLMKEALEGAVPFDDVLPYVDRCLGCVACETSCPSGVRYGELLSPFRAYTESRRRRSWGRRILREFVLRTLPYPWRFRWAARAGRVARHLRGLLPRATDPLLALLPSTAARRVRLEVLYPARGERRERVALLVGCAQSVLEPEINAATIRVLTALGVEVVVPRGQQCCGALSLHTGRAPEAARFARQALRAFPRDVDAIVTNAAGCGSGMHEYPLLLKGTSHESEARSFAAKVRDVAEYLDAVTQKWSLELPRLACGLTVAYHDACHLAHAQRTTTAPRRLLGRIEGLRVVTPEDSEICCGSAGVYNIEQPELASKLGARKARALAATGAAAIVTGNIGCTMQIRSHLAARGEADRPVLHTVEVLDRALRGELAGTILGR